MPRIAIIGHGRAGASFAAPERAPAGWTEERVVVAGFVIMAVLAGLIIFVASYFDSLT